MVADITTIIVQFILDNFATSPIPHTYVDFKGIREAHTCTLLYTSVHDVLPHYLRSEERRVGKELLDRQT